MSDPANKKSAENLKTSLKYLMVFGSEISLKSNLVDFSTLNCSTTHFPDMHVCLKNIFP